MKTVIFDFDQIMADTSALEHLRTVRNWQSAYAALHQIRIYPGITDLLRHCREKGYKVAVVTNSPKRYCELALASLNIEVDAIVGYHDTSKHKPSPDPVLLALKMVGGTASGSYGLGDNINDILAYHAAGVTPVACLWGCENHSVFADADYCLKIHHPLDIIGHKRPKASSN